MSSSLSAPANVYTGELSTEVGWLIWLSSHRFTMATALVFLGILFARRDLMKSPNPRAMVGVVGMVGISYLRELERTCAVFKVITTQRAKACQMGERIFPSKHHGLPNKRTDIVPAGDSGAGANGTPELWGQLSPLMRERKRVCE
jgi:hypothetical protein